MGDRDLAGLAADRARAAALGALVTGTMETACLTKGAGEVALVLPRGLAHAMGAGSCTTGARACVACGAAGLKAPSRCTAGRWQWIFSSIGICSDASLASNPRTGSSGTGARAPPVDVLPKEEKLCSPASAVEGVSASGREGVQACFIPNRSLVRGGDDGRLGDRAGLDLEEGGSTWSSSARKSSLAR
jgi:hypothetical protein